jgi:hypothetical protein
MAEKRTIELEVKQQGLDQVTEKTKSLKQQLKEMKLELSTMDEGSQGFKDLLAEAGKLQDKIGDLNQQVKNFASDTAKVDVALGGISAVTGGFEAVTGAMGLMGVENKNLEKALLRVQSAMAIANGVQQVQIALQKESALMKGIDTAKTWLLATATSAYTFVVGTSTGALKLFRIALVSTGIGAIVVLIGLLIANFDAVKNAVIGAYDKFNKLGPAVKAVIMIIFPFIGAIVGIVKALEYFGVVDDATTRKNKANAEARTKAVEKEANLKANLAKKKQKSDDDYYSHEINLAKANGKETYQLELAKAKAHLASGRVFLSAQALKIKAYQEEILMLIATGDADSDRVKTLKKSMAESKKVAAESYKDNLATKQAIEVMEAEHRTELRNNAKGSAVEQKDIARDLQDAKLQLLKDGQEKEIEAINLKYKRENEDLEKEVKAGTKKRKQVDELIKLNLELQEKDLAVIRDKYAKEKIKKQDEEWLATQKLTLSAREYEELLLAQKYDSEQEKASGNAQLEKELTEQHQTELVALRKRFAEEDLKIAEDLSKAKLEAEKQYNALVLSEEELAKLNVQSKADSELLALQTNFNNKLLTQEQFETAKKALTEKTNGEIAKLDEDADKKKQELLAKQIDAVKGGLTSIANIAELFAGKSKKSQKRAFNIQKATNIASATIDTFTSAQSAYKSVVGIPIVGPVLAPLASAGAIAMGLINIKKIKESQFEGGAEPSAGGGGGGETGGGGAPQAPQFNVVGNNGMNQLAQLQQKPVQAFVVSSEMTSAQALERNRINNATI